MFLHSCIQKKLYGFSVRSYASYYLYNKRLNTMLRLAQILSKINRNCDNMSTNNYGYTHTHNQCLFGSSLAFNIYTAVNVCLQPHTNYVFQLIHMMTNSHVSLVGDHFAFSFITISVTKYTCSVWLSYHRLLPLYSLSKAKVGILVGGYFAISVHHNLVCLNTLLAGGFFPYIVCPRRIDQEECRLTCHDRLPRL